MSSSFLVSIFPPFGDHLKPFFFKRARCLCLASLAKRQAKTKRILRLRLNRGNHDQTTENPQNSVVTRTATNCHAISKNRLTHKLDNLRETSLLNPSCSSGTWLLCQALHHLQTSRSLFASHGMTYCEWFRHGALVAPCNGAAFFFFGGGRPPFFFVDRQPVLFVLGEVVSHPLEHFFDDFFHWINSVSFFSFYFFVSFVSFVSFFHINTLLRTSALNCSPGKPRGGCSPCPVPLLLVRAWMTPTPSRRAHAFHRGGRVSLSMLSLYPEFILLPFVILFDLLFCIWSKRPVS